MVPSARLVVCVLLLLVVAAHAQAQSSGAKDQTASISGKVTFKNKGIGGIVVVMVNDESSWQRARHRATTDAEGNYRISNIPAGNYHAFPLAPALVVEKGDPLRLLAISAGESIRDVDFAMVRGGVITGRITNADGQPLIEEMVSLVLLDSEESITTSHTDDRGIYRAFGLRQGKYKVSVGQMSQTLPGYVPKVYKQTFHPSVTDPDKATVIELTEGGEIRDVDIVVAGSVSMFTVSGRVIDGETGKPLSGITFAVFQTQGNSMSSAAAATSTNSNGEFKLHNVLPGRYMLFIAPQQGSDLLADSLTFEVVDKDLTGLEMKAERGATVSGMVVLEGANDKSIIAKLSQVHLYARVENPSLQFGGTSRSTTVGADGSFKIGGLPAGNAEFSFDYDTRQFAVLRVEQNGMPQPGGITIKDGEQVTGVRVVVKHVKLTGAIRGQVKIENGELPPTAQIRLVVNLVDQNQSATEGSALEPAAVDSRGRFFVGGLAAGTYEVRAYVFQGQQRLDYDVPAQVVTVSEDAVSEITLTIKVKP